MSEQIPTKIGNSLVEGNDTGSDTGSSQTNKKVRPRKPTLLKLQWLAERVRRCEAIKKQLAEGSYQVDSQAIAKAILNIDKE